MKLNRIHAIIGLLLVLVPFTGLTRGVKYGFMVIAGSIILYFAVYSIHVELKKKHRRPHKHDSFVESKPMRPEPEAESESSADIFTPPEPPAELPL
ncbi:MAG: hypothetical protein V4438_03105 [Patescibacteria group bacterium]